MSPFEWALGDNKQGHRPNGDVCPDAARGVDHGQDPIGSSGVAELIHALCPPRLDQPAPPRPGEREAAGEEITGAERHPFSGRLLLGPGTADWPLILQERPSLSMMPEAIARHEARYTSMNAPPHFPMVRNQRSMTGSTARG